MDDQPGWEGRLRQPNPALSPGEAAGEKSKPAPEPASVLGRSLGWGTEGGEEFPCVRLPFRGELQAAKPPGMNDDRPRLTDAECEAFLDRLLPQGLAGADVVEEIAPEGWEQSPLLACFHPSPERVFEERLQIHRNLARLARPRREGEPDNPAPVPRPEPTFEEVRTAWKETAVNAADEVTDLIGMCLWDVFSDNHEVITAEGRVADLGSFRGAAGFIAEYVSGLRVEGSFDTSTQPSPRSRRRGSSILRDYMDYYMGTIWIGQRADLAPVYRMIFRRLKALDADWEYHFPELAVVDLSPLRQQLEPSKPEDYSPSEAFAAEEAERERQTELAEMQATLAEGNEQARQEAMDRPAPPVVRAYEDVFGREPRGWPPDGG